MSTRYRLALVLLVTLGLMLTGLVYAAWPATGSLEPIVIPTTYGPPGPDGGPR